MVGESKRRRVGDYKFGVLLNFETYPETLLRISLQATSSGGAEPHPAADLVLQSAQSSRAGKTASFGSPRAMGPVSGPPLKGTETGKNFGKGWNL